MVCSSGSWTHFQAQVQNMLETNKVEYLIDNVRKNKKQKESKRKDKFISGDICF